MKCFIISEKTPAIDDTSTFRDIDTSCVTEGDTTGIDTSYVTAGKSYRKHLESVLQNRSFVFDVKNHFQ